MRRDDTGEEGERTILPKADGDQGRACQKEGVTRRSGRLSLRQAIGPIERRVRCDVRVIDSHPLFKSESTEETARRLYYRFSENLAEASRWTFERMRGLEEGSESYERWRLVFLLLRRWGRGVRDGDRRRKDYAQRAGPHAKHKS